MTPTDPTVFQRELLDLAAALAWYGFVWGLAAGILVGAALAGIVALIDGRW